MLHLLQVYNLLHNVRSNPEGVKEDESYTARVLRDAITPECVQHVRSSTNEELLQQFRELVMRMSFHLGREERRLLREAAAAAALAAATRRKGGKRKQQQQQQQHDATQPTQQQQQPAAASDGSGISNTSDPPALASSLDKVVDDYSVAIMLVSMVSFKSIQRLCLYSLDTLQTASPPAGYWAEVLAEMQLSTEQMQQVAHAWGIYAEKIAPHFKRTQELAQQVREMLLAADLASSGMSRLTLSSTSGSASALCDHQQLDASAAAAAEEAKTAEAAGAEAEPGDAASPMQTETVELQQLQEPVLQAGQQQQGDQRQQQQADQQQQQGDQQQQQPQQGDQQPQGHGLQQPPHHDGLPHHLQPRSGGSSSSSGPSSSSTGCGTRSSGAGSGASAVKPWQEFGLGYTSGLGVEEADKLQELLTEMTQHFGAMSQLSHAHTFPVWNMLSRLQLARMAVASYPFMPNVCQSELGLCLSAYISLG
jgi:hypothetical protein